MRDEMAAPVSERMDETTAPTEAVVCGCFTPDDWHHFWWGPSKTPYSQRDSPCDKACKDAACCLAGILTCGIFGDCCRGISPFRVIS